jgi:hypothetical protein
LGPPPAPAGARPRRSGQVANQRAQILGHVPFAQSLAISPWNTSAALQQNRVAVQLQTGFVNRMEVDKPEVQNEDPG